MRTSAIFNLSPAHQVFVPNHDGFIASSCQYFTSSFCHQYGVFKLRTSLSIASYSCPIVTPRPISLPTQINHWFHSENMPSFHDSLCLKTKNKNLLVHKLSTCVHCNTKRDAEKMMPNDSCTQGNCDRNIKSMLLYSTCENETL